MKTMMAMIESSWPSTFIIFIAAEVDIDIVIFMYSPVKGLQLVHLGQIDLFHI